MTTPKASKFGTPQGTVTPPSPQLPSPGATLKCAECEREIEGHAVCSGCLDNAIADAAEEEHDDFQASAASRVRAWAQREKLLAGSDPIAIAALERCAQALEDGDA